jgi:hypothetical protein
MALNDEPQPGAERRVGRDAKRKKTRFVLLRPDEMTDDEIQAALDALRAPKDKPAE